MVDSEVVHGPHQDHEIEAKTKTNPSEVTEVQKSHGAVPHPPPIDHQDRQGPVVQQPGALQVVMDAAAQQKVLAPRWCPFVAVFGFETLVEDAYQGWHANYRMWGCLTMSLLGLFSTTRIVVTLVLVNTPTSEYQCMNTGSLLFAVFVFLRVLCTIPCLTALYMGITQTEAAKMRGFFRWQAEGMCLAVNLSSCLFLVNKFHHSDTTSGDSKKVAHAYFTAGCAFAGGPILSLLLLKVGIWQPILFSAVYAAIAISSPHSLGTGVIAPMVGLSICGSVVMLIVDQTSRAEFLLHLKDIRHVRELAAAHEAIQKADRKALAAVQATKEADSMAFTAINHCAKRVFFNNLQWSDDLSGHVTPDLKSGEQSKVDKAIRNLEVITQALKMDNKKGFHKCRTTIALKQMAAGTYVPVPESVNIRVWLKEQSEFPNMHLNVAHDVPEFISLPVVPIESILDNAISNAATHGKQNGRISMDVTPTDGGFLSITLQNEPGAQHHEALMMQAEHGEGAVLQGPAAHDMSSVGSASSTFLGGVEMAGCAAAANQDVSISLVFCPDSVVFTLCMKLVRGTAPKTGTAEPTTLKDNAFLICADDDAAPRMAYKGLAKKLGVSCDRLMVLGGTFEEVSGLKDTVLKAAQTHGMENLVCIFDQNMDHSNYKGRKVLGTSVIRELRMTGFKGVIFIRSANDELSAVHQFREAGANGTLGKGSKVGDLALEVVKQTNLAWEIGICDPISD